MTAAHPMIPEPWFVRRARTETHDVRTLELEPSRSDITFSFAAGQFNMLYVFGVGEVPISMSGAPSNRGMLVHTVRAAGAVTHTMTRLRAGAVIGVRGPFGSCWPVEQATGGDVLIVAGGIGLAPLRPVLYTVLSARENYHRIVVLYGARTPKDLLYKKELEKWRARLDVEVEVTVDSAASDWQGHVGVVTTLISKADWNAKNATAMVCGPEIMMQFVIRELQKRGLASEKIFLSMERNMKCAVGFCGHCQFGPSFVCKDGPVFSYAGIRKWFETREI